ncbi:MAG: hypothetical protein AB7U95_35170 [Reyranella sp.]
MNRTLERRIARLDHRVQLHGGDVSRLSDAQLEALLISGLRKSDPALARRYAAADDDERETILKAIAGAGQ